VITRAFLRAALVMGTATTVAVSLYIGNVLGQTVGVIR